MSEALYGIFGGTFDPIHKGHLYTVASAHLQCSLTRTLFIPSATPPHKQVTSATAEQRLDMVALAIAPFPQFVLDDRELRRPAPSHTIDTIESLKADNAARKYCFIIGIDAMLKLESWYRWKDLLESVHFIVMNRPGWDTPASLAPWWKDRYTSSAEALNDSAAGKIISVNVEPTAISSSDIRYGIANKCAVVTMLPDPVWRYIREHKIYTQN